MVLLVSALPFLALLLMPAVASLSGWPAPMLLQIRRALFPTVFLGGVSLAVFALTGGQYVQAGVALLGGSASAATLWFDHDDETIALAGGLSLGAVIAAPLSVVGIVLGVLIVVFSFCWPRILVALQGGSDQQEPLMVAYPRRVDPSADSRTTTPSALEQDPPVGKLAAPIEKPSLPFAGLPPTPGGP